MHNIPNIMRATSVKVSVKDEKICNQMMKRKGSERFGEVGIVDKMNGIGRNFAKERE